MYFFINGFKYNIITKKIENTIDNIGHVGSCVNNTIIINVENMIKFDFVGLFNDLIKNRIAKYPNIIENQLAYNPPYIPISIGNDVTVRNADKRDVPWFEVSSIVRKYVVIMRRGPKTKGRISIEFVKLEEFKR
jgi:hypothetical protein